MSVGKSVWEGCNEIIVRRVMVEAQCQRCGFVWMQPLDAGTAPSVVVITNAWAVRMCHCKPGGVFFLQAAVTLDPAGAPPVRLAAPETEKGG